MSRHCDLHARRNWRTNFACCLASSEYLPCFQFARFERANPISVRGPVLVPPCIRQRLLSIAGPMQRVPLRVLAPHRGAMLGSPTGLLFFSHPRRFAWGSLLVFLVIPTPRCTVVYGPNNGLTAAVNMNVLDSHLLFPFTPICFERFHLRCKRSQQTIGRV
jgi:hypothetical protein